MVGGRATPADWALARDAPAVAGAHVRRQNGVRVERRWTSDFRRWRSTATAGVRTTVPRAGSSSGHACSRCSTSRRRACGRSSPPPVTGRRRSPSSGSQAEGRRGALVHGTSSSTDVAALALGLARSVDERSSQGCDAGCASTCARFRLAGEGRRSCGDPRRGSRRLADRTRGSSSTTIRRSARGGSRTSSRTSLQALDPDSSDRFSRASPTVLDHARRILYDEALRAQPDHAGDGRS